MKFTRSNFIFFQVLYILIIKMFLTNMDFVNQLFLLKYFVDLPVLAIVRLHLFAVI